MAGKRVTLSYAPGTNPEPDETSESTLHFVETDKVMFQRGKLRTILNRQVADDTANYGIRGCVRSIFGYRSGGIDRHLFGSHSGLYAMIGGRSYNITPLKTSNTAIANSLDTDYQTLGANPLTTVNASTTVTVAQAAHKYLPGDIVTLSGVPGAVNGIPAAELNAAHYVTGTTTNTWTLVVGTAATSSGTGGAGAVVSRSAVIVVNAVAHGMSNGDRAKLSGAAITAGIPAGEINAEHEIRQVATDSFRIAVTTAATSSVTGGGGAATVYHKPIDAGECDMSEGAGFGAGLFGAGLFGAGTSSGTYIFPRIWSKARYGNDVVMTPGEGTGVYLWQNSTSTAPAALSGAPTQANWVFESHKCVCVLGADGVENRIKASDVGNATGWTPGPASYAYSDDVEGVGKFISQVRAGNDDLLFTERSVHLLRWVGKPDIWDISDVMLSDGLIAPLARIEIEGRVFWWGLNDFYLYDGSSVQTLGDNTVRQWLAENLRTSQRWKIFCWHDAAARQIWWHFPTGSNEPGSYVIYSYAENHWTLGAMSVTAVEGPVALSQYPFMVSSTSATGEAILTKYGLGTDNAGAVMSPNVKTSWGMIGDGDNVMEIMALYPDLIQEGTLLVRLETKMEAHESDDDAVVYGPFQLTATTQRVPLRARGRLRRYHFYQSAVNESFAFGKLQEEVRVAGGRG